MSEAAAKTRLAHTAASLADTVREMPGAIKDCFQLPVSRKMATIQLERRERSQDTFS